MGHRDRLGDADEWDAFHRGSRRVLCVFDRAGVVRKTKSRFNRRVRRQAKISARAEAGSS